MTKSKKLLPWLFGGAGGVLLGVVIGLVVLFTRPTGWVQEEGVWYYYDDRGKPVSGWLEEGDTRRYLLSDGSRAEGWQEVDGKTLYFDENGRLATGWAEIDGVRRCLNQEGTPLTGWQEINGKTYYLNHFGNPVTGWIIIDDVRHVFHPDGTLVSGWFEDDSGKYYILEDGTPATGWVEDEGLKYYLDENGHPVTGWQEIDGQTYYLKENGTMATGIVTIDGQKRFFDSRGQELLMVNPWNPVPDGYTVDLVSIGSGHQIAACAYADFQEMFAACKADGNQPVITSSYRTMEHQQDLYTRKIKYFLRLGYDEEAAIAEAGTIVAVPGTSEHQLGLALDLADMGYPDLDTAQEATPSQQWLMANSWRYGFILRYPNGKSDITGIIYEPWHYRYVGRELAAEIHGLDLCLEEYLEMLTTE